MLLIYTRRALGPAVPFVFSLLTMVVYLQVKQNLYKRIIRSSWERHMGVMRLNENTCGESLEGKHSVSVECYHISAGYEELMSTLSGIKSWSNWKTIRRQWVMNPFYCVLLSSPGWKRMRWYGSIKGMDGNWQQQGRALPHFLKK